MEARCFKHPEVIAVTKCTDCGKSLCTECLFYRDGAVFCGPECAQRTKLMGKDLHRKLDRVRSGPGMLVPLVRLALLAAVALAILQFFHFVDVLKYFR